MRKVEQVNKSNGSKSIQHTQLGMTFKIFEHFRRQWHVAILGIDLNLDSSLQGRIGYRITSEQSIAGWEGSDTAQGPPSGSCPPEPVQWMTETFENIQQSLTPRAFVKEVVKRSPIRSLAEGLDPRVHCSHAYEAYHEAYAATLSNASA